MALADTGRRTRSLLVAVVVGHVLLVSAQVGTAAGPSLLRAAVVGVVTELQEVSWLVAGGMRAAWDGFAALRGARAENARLMQENTDLRVQLQQATANAADAGDMRALLELRPHVPWKTTGADVVAGSISPDFRAITIDKGASDGIRSDMPVINAAGVIGRVALPVGHTATVQLIIDRSAAVAARIARSGTEAIALGNGDGTLRLEYVSTTADIQVGDAVVTAGLDGIYPPGLAVGVVEQAVRAGTAYRRVLVRPLVDFSRLATVLVLIAPAPVWAPPVPAPAEKAGR
jgi:rod shape-determining protein MreC